MSLTSQEFARKAWEGFGGQVQEDGAGIWLQPEGQRKTGKENRCLTFLGKKTPEPEPKRTADTDADFLLPQFRPENSTITQRSKLFA